ncbi:hypothetical protein GCM10009647_050740 [Streptomyces sanglieri]
MVLLGEVDTQGARTGGDQREAADASRVPGHVEECEVATRRMREHVHPVETEMLAQGLHVGDLTVDAVGRRIGGDGGAAGTPRIERDQPAPARQAAEIAETGGGTHRTAGQEEQRLSLALRRWASSVPSGAVKVGAASSW